MLSLVSINIVSEDDILGRTLINKDGVPVVLYTAYPHATLGELGDRTTDVGAAMRNFIINNIARPTYSSKDDQPDLYAHSDIVYIYYNQETKDTGQGRIHIQDVFKLDINSDEADEFYLSAYYIRKAAEYVCKLMKLQRMRKYDISGIMTNDKLEEFYNTIRGEYSPSVLTDFKSFMKNSLYDLGLNDENVKRIIL